MARSRTAAIVVVALAAVIAAAAVVTLLRRDDARSGLVAAPAPETTPSTTAAVPGGDGSGTAPAPMPTVATTAATTAAVPAARPLEGRTVAVDPGHNGRNGSAPAEINRQVDAGGFRKACNTTGSATAGGVKESTVNLAIARGVESRLQALGARVVLTRQDDQGVGPCIDERAAIANRAGADLLLSIHADGAPTGARGFHVIRPGLVKGYTDDIVGSSSTLATTVRDALLAKGMTPSTYAGTNGLVTRTDLGTLNRSDVPACMVELGNLRNPAEAAALTSPEGQARAAEALVAGVLAWLSRPTIERSGPAPADQPTPGTGKE